MLSISWCQHPVGHGGFHTGRARAEDGANFTWVFDCGARRGVEFATYLRNWTRAHQDPIDWLFVSHFDTDHANGLETLMSRSVVRDVMLPYVNDRELAVSLLHEINRDHLERWLFELAADPAAFFLNRGAARVTFLGSPPQPPEEADDPVIWGDGGSDIQPNWKVTVSPPPRSLTPPKAMSVAASPHQRVQHIRSATCKIRVLKSHGAGLLLKPYRAPLDRRTHRKLLNDLKALVGSTPRIEARPGLGELAYSLAQQARTSSGRSQLRSLYKQYVGSSNRASLSLLSTPIVPDGDTNHRWQVDSSTYYRHRILHWRSRNDIPGWLTTGDAELLNTSDLSDWSNHYASELSEVRVLGLPHHGSDRNSSNALQQLCPKAVFTAHVKKGSTKHPGSHVAEAAGSRLIYVTNEAGTQLNMDFRLY